ncbi:MAG: Alanyl-tRNA synthetase [Evtepia sp.]|nr:Alanyl-tRNA synthetase [Evtepia sp.]
MSKPFGVNDLREMFLSFFETKEHLRLPSYSLIPQNDNSLLLINSGMAPMKPFFTGEQEPPRRRVCTCQKCIRTGDIENIGKTARHGTYFEMLGNFSFGDYFKKEAISWSWEFLTSPDWAGLDPEHLYPSVYEEDDEAYDLWNQHIGIPKEKIVRLGKKDNFWEHGAGPCGPCSEIYFDRGEVYGCGSKDCYPGCDCDRFMEIWNNVFSQFDNDGNGNYTELAQKNIDTGMGLERLAVVCQGVDSLFDVDTVMNITNKVSEITGAHYGESKEKDVSLRIITDHIRSATFMICDGVLPSNEGRGYVLRRLLRRAARHGKLLGVNEPFLYSVCATVISENEGHYTDLTDKAAYITRVIHEEEKKFAKTIDGGMCIFSDLLEGYKAQGEKVFSGADAFKLYDTYGFPIDLTEEMAEDAGMALDRAAFDVEMNEQRTRARKAREAMGDLGWGGIEFGQDVPATEFVGYQQNGVQVKVLAIVAEDEQHESIASGVEAILVLDKTPFYAEMGGQVADHGVLTAEGVRFEVTNVLKNKGEKFMHYGKVLEGEVKLNDALTASYDEARRRAIARAHSATHLLQEALVRTLGDHVHQAGSLVEPDHLRFDFTHFSAVSTEELEKVEKLVNEAILEGLSIGTEEMSIANAKEKGATALFGEKYGETVRVVSMGDFSAELCGGTHLDNTAKAGAFHIVSEFSVASGVRRIEATTGMATLDQFKFMECCMQGVASLLKARPEELRERLECEQMEAKELRRRLTQYQLKESLSEVNSFLLSAKNVGPLKVLTASRPGADANSLRQMGDFLRDKEQTVVAVLATVIDEKITFLAVCGKEAIAKGVKAGDVIRHVTAICGGKGGGKPDSAMGGGTDLLKLDNALASVDDFVAEKLGL